MTEDAIERIAAAIDQLARDVHAGQGGGGPDGYAAAVADIWLMLTALDPGLAALIRRYTD